MTAWILSFRKIMYCRYGRVSLQRSLDLIRYGVLRMQLIVSNAGKYFANVLLNCKTMLHQNAFLKKS